MAGSHDDEVLALVGEISKRAGVRWAMIANPEGALGAGANTGLQPAAANDLAKTVRRMVVASMTATAPLRELLINFGPSRMVVRPLNEDAILIVLAERDVESEGLRTQLDDELLRLQRVLAGEAGPPLDEIEAEIRQLRGGELGPLIDAIEAQYSSHSQALGRTPAGVAAALDAQLRDWLSDCNPSTYTLPLLLDGLAETLTVEARNPFVSDVQDLLRRADALR